MNSLMTTRWPHEPMSSFLIRSTTRQLRQKETPGTSPDFVNVNLPLLHRAHTHISMLRRSRDILATNGKHDMMRHIVSGNILTRFFCDRRVFATHCCNSLAVSPRSPTKIVVLYQLDFQIISLLVSFIHSSFLGLSVCFPPRHMLSWLYAYVRCLFLCTLRFLDDSEESKQTTVWLRTLSTLPAKQRPHGPCAASPSI